MKVYGDAQAATLHRLGNQTTAGVHENVDTVTWRALIRVAVKVNHSAHGPESRVTGLPGGDQTIPKGNRGTNVPATLTASLLWLDPVSYTHLTLPTNREV